MAEKLETASGLSVLADIIDVALRCGFQELSLTLNAAGSYRLVGAKRDGKTIASHFSYDQGQVESAKKLNDRLKNGAPIKISKNQDFASYL